MRMERRRRSLLGLVNLGMGWREGGGFAEDPKERVWMEMRLDGRRSKSGGFPREREVLDSPDWTSLSFHVRLTERDVRLCLPRCLASIR